jgi:hypothetical protein
LGQRKQTPSYWMPWNMTKNPDHCNCRCIWGSHHCRPYGWSWCRYQIVRWTGWTYPDRVVQAIKANHLILMTWTYDDMENAFSNLRRSLCGTGESAREFLQSWWIYEKFAGWWINVIGSDGMKLADWHQLRGRAGRQGDPGSSRFYLSQEDTWCACWRERVESLMAPTAR